MAGGAEDVGRGRRSGDSSVFLESFGLHNSREFDASKITVESACRGGTNALDLSDSCSDSLAFGMSGDSESQSGVQSTICSDSSPSVVSYARGKFECISPFVSAGELCHISGELVDRIG
jgi:hypothetical protein